MQERVYQKKIRNIDELQESVVEELEWLDQSVIDSVIRECRYPLRAHVKARG